MLNEQGMEVCSFCGESILEDCGCKEETQQHYIGLDPSLTGFGAVDYELPTGSIRAAVFSSNPASGIYNRMWRFDDLLGQLMAWMPEQNVIGIAVKAYSYGSKGGMAFDRIEFGGLLRHWLVCDVQLPVIEVAPSTLKLFVVGKGGGKINGQTIDKTAVALAAFKRYGVEFGNDNQTDAYVLARMAACLSGAEEPQTDFQTRALEKLK